MSDYNLEGPKWATNTVTWSFATSTYAADSSDPFSATVTGAYQSTIEQAFAAWAAVSGLKFQKVADTPASGSTTDIRVGFGTFNTQSTGTIGQTNLRYTIQGGQSFLVPDEVVRVEDPSQLALVASGNNNFTYAGTSATLQQVATHEIGHALGLDHASEPQAIMYSQAGANNQTLDATDVAGIQALYGAPASVSVATPVIPVTPATPAAAPTTPAPNTPPPTTPAPTTSVLVGGTGADTLALFVSEDAYKGDAKFTVTVDGSQVGGVQTVGASHGSKNFGIAGTSAADQEFDVKGNFGAGPHTASIAFLNDAWDGTQSTDRNLYVDHATINSSTIAGSSLAELSNGSSSFVFQGSAAAASSDTLHLLLSEDAYQGDARFTATLDGKLLGPAQSVTTLHHGNGPGNGPAQDFAFSGAFGAGSHHLDVSFINDAWGGTPDTDRNLYVNGVSFDGRSVPGASASLLQTSTYGFVIPATAIS